MFGRIWPMTTSSGSSVAVAARRQLRPRILPGSTDRDQQQQVGEGQVGQHAPAAHEALQVLEGLGPELGVGLRASSAGVGTAPRPRRCGLRTATGYGAGSPGSPGESTPPRPARPAGRRPGRPRGRAGGRRTPWSAAPRGRRSVPAAAAPGTAPRPACATPPTRPRPPCPRRRRLGDAVPPLRRAVGRCPATLIRSGWASTSQAPVAASSSSARCRPPSRRRPGGRPLGHVTGSSRSSKRQAPTQCTEPSRTSKGYPASSRPRRPCARRSSPPPGRSRRAGRRPWPAGHRST